MTEEIDVEVAEMHSEEEEPKVEKAPEPEDYEVTAEELLTLQLLMTRVEKQRADLQLAQQFFEIFRNSVSGKYSEYGKYTLLGEVDFQTRQGKRVLAK